MTRLNGHAAKGWVGIVCCAAWLYLAGSALAYTCSSNNPDEVPPFLAEGVDPNLLLMIDNSGSMYDLAYIEEEGYCYDDSFNSASAYHGYFSASTWYVYDLVNGRFEAAADAGACAAAAGTKYTSTSTSQAVCITVDETVSPNVVNAFAAKGNLLNWATASKFDIQKEILTGGKYDAANQRLIMEARGCAGRRFVKDIALDGGNILTLAVRDPEEDEKASPSDDTTRIEIFAVSTTGFDDSACQQAITEASAESPNQGLLKGYIDQCMGNPGTNTLLADANTAFNHAIHNCWYRSKHGTWQAGEGGISSVQNDCDRIYGHGALPPTITPSDSGYICYGIYDEDEEDRQGYVGRCYEPETVWGDCHDVTCTEPDPDIPHQNASKPYLNPFCGEDGKVYDCFGNFNANTGNCSGNPGEWRVRRVGPDCGTAIVTPAHWTDDDIANDPAQCIGQALQDFCTDLDLPEVIDPSDQLGLTSEYLNLPAFLIDSGVLAQLNEPIAILPGYIRQTTAPAGLLQEYAEDIRMGAMIFNNNGSASECAADPKVECPAGANFDGGRLISYIDQNSVHTSSLVGAINAIKATSWTPLAESLYNALGYYTQKTALRLNNGDFVLETEAAAYPHWANGTLYSAGAVVKDSSHELHFTADGGTSNGTGPGNDTGVNWTPIRDPITNWCQDNNVLLITEGASTADLHSSVSTFLATALPDDGDVDGTCGELSGSTYFDDLANYGWQGSSIFQNDPDVPAHPRGNVKTYIVVAGTLRESGAGECRPATLLTNAAQNGGTELYDASNPDQLEAKLREAFESIRAGAASGSAASVISSSRGGEGAVYQAIFWPQKDGPSGTRATWVGEVHALFVDAYGRLYEDTNGNRALDANDEQVVIYYDQTEGKSKACYGELDAAMNCPATSAELTSVKYLWSATKWLSEIDGGSILSNRSAYIYDPSVEKKRYIFTWNDLDNDGIVDSGEVLPFESRDWAALGVGGGRGSVIKDFGVGTSAEVNAIVNWVRGLDDMDPASAPRDRQVLVDFDNNGTDETITWRLGDVIHSTPTAVSRPAEGYHFLYGDSTYGSFVKRYNKRRHVIYYGANDGMLHAANGGFYEESQKKFCRTADCTNEEDAPELGAELWGYVPYNLLPHLKCLTDPGYGHKYYVDQIPRIFDVQIFTEEAACTSIGLTDPGCIHPEGWGTILVGAMRFGGTKVTATDLNGLAWDERVFTSAYFILDITNPETPPVLLGELTYNTDGSCAAGEHCAEMGYTTAMPTMVVMKDGATSEWNLILGSGPTALSGTSTQAGKVAVFPLKHLTAATPEAFRIPNAMPQPGFPPLDRGRFTLADANSFVSDLITVDFDGNFLADSVYFGTVSGSFAGWSGKLYRLVTYDDHTVHGTQEVTYPYDWDGLSTPANNPGVLFDAGKPITGAPSVGWDGHNYWVYFGTGRFYHRDEKSDNSEQGYYGIKEPMDCSGTERQTVADFTWATVTNQETTDLLHGGHPSNQGLLKVDQIEVEGASAAALSDLSCLDGTTDCLPVGDDGQPIATFDKLTDYIVGEECPDDPAADADSIDTGTDGWYRRFLSDRERNLGQATLLGGLLTFTSYQPYADVCLSEGLAYLYGLYYQTGTAFHRSVFGDTDAGETVSYRLSLGKGLATTPNLHVGKQEGAKAFVQTSTGAIVGVSQPNLPYSDYKTGRASWEEVQ